MEVAAQTMPHRYKRGNGGAKNTMSDVTIKQLAQVLGMPVDKLLTQLGEAGLKFSDQVQVIRSTEKG
jgi:translation initiation factor IF-2